MGRFCTRRTSPTRCSCQTQWFEGSQRSILPLRRRVC
ncbi:hypothetical protein LINPERPRIM_LOCUS6931 [Linum perenne]